MFRLKYNRLNINFMTRLRYRLIQEPYSDLQHACSEEIAVVSKYLELCDERLGQFSTSLEEDEAALAQVTSVSELFVLRNTLCRIPSFSETNFR